MENKIKSDFEKTFKSFKKDYLIEKKAHLNNFLKKGFPNRKLENWKFSDLDQVINKNIGQLNFHNDFSIDHKLDSSIHTKVFEHNKITIVNGKLQKIDFSYEDKDRIIITKEKNTINITDENSLLSLNNAFNDGSYKIYVKENYNVKKPLVIYHTIDNHTKFTNLNLQLNFLLDKNSSLRIVDMFQEKSSKNFINIYYNFDLKKNAILKNYKIDNLKNDNVKYSYNNINHENNSLSETFILSSGSSFIKNEINCNLNEKYSSAFVNGVFTLENENHHEIRTCINHLQENTKSYQLIKSVLNDKSKAVYQGKIYVDSIAQKTDGYQLSKAVLLNENTEFNAKPELEIYADDVKCSHGSASGSLSENSIFYLRSRGLNYKEAKNLLIKGFLLDVVEKITDNEIKKFIKDNMGFKE
tara:strand:+ start:313 stop:1551 length:1239 start_codon:yes stop_codon:yes gene_type:complete